MDDNNTTKIKNTHVPDKLYGYGLQVRQMLFELLNCDINCTVSIEKFDDVGIECLTHKEAIQTKSALSNRNPVSDKAVDLWKTLYNWIIAIKENELTMNNTKFTLVINIDKSGDFVSKMNNANSDKEVTNTYTEIKKSFFDTNGLYINQSDSINTYVSTFFDPTNEKIVKYIIKNFKLVILGKEHTNRIYQEFISKTYLPEEVRDLVFDKILGWIEKTTASQVENKKQMQITKKEFQNELIRTQRRINQKQCLIELAKDPTNTEIENQLNEGKNYLRQLELIDVDYDDKLTAIGEYLRASANRTIWAVNGDISDEVIENYYTKLRKIWKTKKNIVELEKDNWIEEKRGKYLYNICIDGEVHMDAIETPTSFKNGCFHELSDKLEIGWHPNYIEKLGDKKQ